MNRQQHENTDKLFAFIVTQHIVRRSLFLKFPIDTGCLTANSYDFRMSKNPETINVMKALGYLGFHNFDKLDRGAFVRQTCTNLIYDRRNSSGPHPIMDVPTMRKYIVGFRNYDRVKKSHIAKWKLLPQTKL